jgi:hypothetical protein
MSSNKPINAIASEGRISPKKNWTFNSLDNGLNITNSEPKVIGVTIASPPRYATGSVWCFLPPG